MVALGLKTTPLRSGAWHDALYHSTPCDVLISGISRGVRCPAKIIDDRCGARPHALFAQQVAPVPRPIGHAVLGTPRGVQPDGFPRCALRAHGRQRRCSNPRPCASLRTAFSGHFVKPRPQPMVRSSSAARDAVLNAHMADSSKFRTHGLAYWRLEMAPWITRPKCRENLWCFNPLHAAAR